MNNNNMEQWMIALQDKLQYVTDNCNNKVTIGMEMETQLQSMQMEFVRS